MTNRKELDKKLYLHAQSAFAEGLPTLFAWTAACKQNIRLMQQVIKIPSQFLQQARHA